jgi:hypothetical protein
VHITPPSSLGILLYTCHYVIVACVFTLQELNETLECIIPFVYHLETYLVENSLVVLCLADRTLVEVE